MKTISSLFAAVVVATLLFTPASLLATDATKAPAAMTDAATQAAGMVEKLNINTASLDSLSAIPGVGDKISEAIVAYREANGAFKSVSDLMNVQGIDAALLEKIKPFLSI